MAATQRWTVYRCDQSGGITMRYGDRSGVSEKIEDGLKQLRRLRAFLSTRISARSGSGRLLCGSRPRRSCTQGGARR